jgi:predicted acylesterase/phospholipase RssA
MKYDVVFEGGGAKGMVFVGACDEFTRRGHTFGRLLGTSAGAITAALLAAGYTTDEMSAALSEKENGKSVFAGFMGQPAPFTDTELESSAMRSLLDGIKLNFVFDSWEKKLDDAMLKAMASNEKFRHILALIERGGWFAADKFVTWLQTKLDAGKHNGVQRAFSGMTLAQFFAATNVELSLVASDTTDARLLVLNHQTAPDCPLVWAVRMSMSIPLVWDEVVWKPAWGKYLGNDMAGHCIVDGGVLSNFAIELFVSDAPHVTKLMGAKTGNEVLGMLIDERVPVGAAKWKPVTFDIKPGDLQMLQRLQRLVDTATTAHDKMVIAEYAHLVVHLPAQGYGTTEFDMPDEKRAALVDAGRLAMQLYFDNPAGLLLPTKGAPGTPVQSTADQIATHLLQ